MFKKIKALFSICGCDPCKCDSKVYARIFKGKNKQWYFHIKSKGNNKIVAQSEGYKNRKDCESSASLITDLFES